MPFFQFILLATIFLIPLLGVTNQFGYEKIKILFFILIISLIGFVWLIRQPADGSSIKWTGITKAAGLFIAVLLVTSLTGINTADSLLGVEPYFQGWILYACLFVFYILVRTSKIPLQHWIYVLVGSACVVALAALRQWMELNIFNLPVLTYAGRVVSTFGQPNFYSGYLLLTLPLVFFLKTKLKFITPPLLILAILVSGSRIAYIILIFLIFCLLTLTLKSSYRKIIVFITVVVVGLSLATSVYLCTGFYQQEVCQSQGQYWIVGYSAEQRQYLWPVILDLISKRPAQGYGLENLAKVFGSNLHPEVTGDYPAHALVDVKNLNVDRSHNYILDLLIFGGIGGLLSWLMMMVLVFKKLGQKIDDRRKNVLIMPLIIYLIWIQFQNQSVVHLIYFWLLVGLIDSENNHEK